MSGVEFRISPSTYFRIECGRLLHRLLPISALIAFTGVMMLAVDVRYALVALIVLFLVIPFAAYHVYFSKLLNTKAVRALALKRVTIHPDASVTVTYLRQADKDTDPIVDYIEEIPFDKIKNIQQSGANIAITLRPADDYLLVIPKEALTAEEIDYILCKNPVGYMDKNN